MATVVLCQPSVVFAQIETIETSDLHTSGVDDMEAYGFGNFDDIIAGTGISYGERFAGQSLAADDPFDVVTGSPVGTLSLLSGAASQNLATLPQSTTTFLLGLSATDGGYQSTRALGEGAIAVLFDHDHSEFGFEFLGASNGGDAFISFFRRDGSLIDSITIVNVANGGIGFRRTGGIADIAGAVMTNNEVNGFGINTVLYNIPGPSGQAVFVAAAPLAARRRRRDSAA